MKQRVKEWSPLSLRPGRSWLFWQTRGSGRAKWAGWRRWKIGPTPWRNGSDGWWSWAGCGSSCALWGWWTPRKWPPAACCSPPVAALGVSTWAGRGHTWRGRRSSYRTTTTPPLCTAPCWSLGFPQPRGSTQWRMRTTSLGAALPPQTLAIRSILVERRRSVTTSNMWKREHVQSDVKYGMANRERHQ